MKKFFALLLLVTAMAAIGCEKKPATTPATPAPSSTNMDKPVETPPVDAPAK